MSHNYLSGQIPSKLNRIAFGLTVAFAANYSAAVHAQSEAVQLEEVVVTATKRAQSIQDVPLAITALSSETLDRAGIVDITSLERVAPSFHLNTTDSNTGGVTLRVRGVGTSGNNIGFESSVGVFIDGIFVPRPGGALNDLLDVERIEILRGPQGTLFGRNTSAGALVIHTKRPDLNEFGYFGSLTGGNYDLFAGQAGINVPIIEGTLGMKIAASYRERDGFVDGAFGGDSYGRDREAIDLDLLWDMGDAGDLRIKASYAESQDECCLAVWHNDSDYIVNEVVPYVDPALGLGEGAGVPPSLVGRDALEDGKAVDDDFENPARGTRFSLEYNVETGIGDLTYLFGYSDGSALADRQDYVQTDAYTTGATPQAKALNPERPYRSWNGTDTDNFSHEIRLRGLAFNDRLDWMVGAYYAEEDVDQRYTLTFLEQMQTAWSVGAFGQPEFNELNYVSGGRDAAGDFNAPNAQQSTESWSIFTHNVFSVTDKFDLTIGLRYVDESKDGSMSEQTTGQHNACHGSFENYQVTVPAYADNPGRLQAAVATNCWIFTAPFYDPDDPDSFYVPYVDNPATAAWVDLIPRPFDRKFEDDELVYTIKGSYIINEDTNVYAGFTHGFKSGGFNLDVSSASGGTDPRFDSEIIDAYEIGLKSIFWEGRALANVAVFYQDLEDFQVLEFDGIRRVTYNVPKAESWGVELESQAQFTESFGMNLGVTYVEAEYPDDCSTFDPNSSDFQSAILPLCGVELTNAPEWAAILGANYQSTVFNGGWDFFANASARYESERRTGTMPTERPNVAGLTTEAEVRAAVDAAVALRGDVEDSNTKVDLRLGLLHRDSNVSIELWGTNIFDERTKFSTFSIPLRGFSGDRARGQFVQEPRLYGLTVRKVF